MPEPVPEESAAADTGARRPSQTESGADSDEHVDAERKYPTARKAEQTVDASEEHPDTAGSESQPAHKPDAAEKPKKEPPRYRAPYIRVLRDGNARDVPIPFPRGHRWARTELGDVPELLAEFERLRADRAERAEKERDERRARGEKVDDDDEDAEHAEHDQDDAGAFSFFGGGGGHHHHGHHKAGKAAEKLVHKQRSADAGPTLQDLYQLFSFGDRNDPYTFTTVHVRDYVLMR